MSKLPLLAVASIVSFAVACGGGEGSGGAENSGTNGPGANGGNPSFNPNDPRTVDLSGTYELSTRYDLTSAGVLPDMASQTLKALSDLKENPSKTILDLLKAAKIPIVDTLLGVIPDSLEAPFEGWFNDYVFAALYDNVPVAGQIAGLIDDIASIATKFEVVSALELAPTSDTGTTTAAHTLTGVGFTILNQRTVVDAPANLGPLTHATGVQASAVHIVERSPDVENGRLMIGDHGFGFPLGDFVILGIDKIAQAKLGAKDLRDALGKAIDCAAIAKDVSEKCAGPVCVGHETEIRDACNAGLDQVVSELKSGLRLLDFDALHLATGNADMFDAPAKDGAVDGKIDRIEHGEWSAFFRVTKAAEKPIVATFTGKRVGDTAAPSAPPPPAK